MNRKIQQKIDLGLSVIEALMQKNNISSIQLTLDDLAEICDCTRGALVRIEAKAKQKMMKRISPEWVRL